MLAPSFIMADMILGGIYRAFFITDKITKCKLKIFESQKLLYIVFLVVIMYMVKWHKINYLPERLGLFF